MSSTLVQHCTKFIQTLCVYRVLSRNFDIVHSVVTRPLVIFIVEILGAGVIYWRGSQCHSLKEKGRWDPIYGHEA